MKRLMALLLAGGLLLSVAAPALAAKPVASGTIAFASLDARFGGEVTFSVTTANLAGNQYPLVYLACWQGSTVVYGQLDQPDAVFVLGGGSSPWYDSPGPATCQATLYAYGGSKGIIQLATTQTFSAAG